MQIYQLRSNAEECRWLTLVSESDFRVLSDLNEGPIGAAWEPLPAEWIEDDLNAGKPKCDFPTLGTTPTFSQRAVDKLLDLLVENGELLPLGLTDERYFVYNATRQVNALDEDRSELVRFSSGRIMDIKRYAFRPEQLQSATIFRLPQVRGAVFVTDRFVERVAEAGLTGFDFAEVWSIEAMQ